MGQTSGAIPMQLIRDMMHAGYIGGASENALQPASLDLTVTDGIYRLRGSYLPRAGEPMADILARGSLFKHPIERPLEHNGIYLVRLAESLKLPKDIHATASNKSSSGRINLRGRLLGEGVPRFDEIPNGYEGSLWLELIPKSFPVKLHAGDRINQIRFFTGDTRLSPLEHRIAYDRFHLLRNLDGSLPPPEQDVVGRGVVMTVDLHSSETIGWRAKNGGYHVLDTARFDHDPQEFFELVPRPENDELVIHPDTFYILSTKEKIITPPTFATEMAAYDSTIGEFRSHFAGFFDPGWGWVEDEAKRGAIAVLEVEAMSHDFVLRDGQPICLMVYEQMLAEPEKLYGSDLKSNYTFQQGPRLAKWFKK
jgi:dCTP deaminase